MKLHVLSVKDNAAQIFGRPFYSQSTGAAIRNFVDEVNRPAVDNQLYKHPDDFDLYFLGTFNDETCEFDCLPHPKVLTRGKDVVVPSEEK